MTTVSGAWLRSITVPVMTVKSFRHSLVLQRYRPSFLVAVFVLPLQCGQIGPSGQRAVSNQTRAAVSSWNLGSLNLFAAIILS